MFYLKAIGIMAITSMSIWMLYNILLRKEFNKSDITLKHYLLFYFCVYITLGIGFSVAYCYSGEEFSVEGTTKQLDAVNSIYYSFITIANSGYGDIHAISEKSKILTVLENMFGHFITVFIAGIILAKKLED